MKKITYLFLGLISLGVTSSCSNFETLNTNPDKSTVVSPDMIVTEILKSNKFWNPNPTDFATGNLWCKHTALAETNPHPSQYYFSNHPYGSFSYKKWTDLDFLVKFATGTPEESPCKGFSLLIRAIDAFSMTLDMGDIPYSEAGKANQGILKPKYDKQEDVFKYILNDLKEAESYFAEGGKLGGDFMYNGDVTKWRKLCNAYQLKVLQTMSKKITAEQKKRFADIVADGNLMKDNSDNYQLVYSNNPNSTHPYYNGFDKQEFNLVTNLVVDYLKSHKDRRLFYFAEPAGAKIAGGLTEQNYEAYVGANPSLDALTLKINNDAKMYSRINIRYTKRRDGDPMLRFTYAEQCFILAEAAEEGWITGDSKKYYEDGVKAMLLYYMNLPSAQDEIHGMAITQSYIDNYFTGDASYPTIKDERLKEIWMQRWLIDFFQGNGGNYAQVLRTGYPIFPNDPATNMNPDDKTVYPKRWKYPTDEFTTNEENYLKAVKEQYGGYDGINLSPWYLK